MKRALSLILALAMMVCLLAAAAPAAFADGVNNNVIKGRSNSNAPGGESNYAIDKLDKLDRDGKIQRPKSDSYISPAHSKFINAPKGHSIYVYSKPSSSGGAIDDAYHGSKVEVLAIEGDWACIVYVNEKFEELAGWVALERLSSNYPCDTIVFGKALIPGDEAFIMVDPEQKWSKQYFVDTDTKYVEVDAPWFNEDRCTALVIDYQVISRNGVKDASGERNIYLNDGSGWEYMGSFDVNSNLDPVRLLVHYDEPKEIKAVAVIPSDSAQEKCLIRQHIHNMHFPYDELMKK